MSRFKSRRGDAALPSRIVQAAIAKLPRPVQAQVLAALHEEGEPRSHAPVPDTPPYVFVVKAGKTLTFHAIREIAWARPDLLGVTFDRRWMGDRRLQERPGHVERRRAQRRSSALDSTWVQRGFVLSITPAPGVARLGRTVDDRHPAVEAAAPADTRPSSSYGEPAALNVTGAPSDPADMEPASNPAGGAERGFLAPQSPDLARSDAVRVSDPTPADTVTPVPSPPSFAAEGAVPVDEPVSAAAVAADDAAPPEGPARPPASATLEPGGEPAPPRLPEPQPAVTTELLPLDATPPCAAVADESPPPVAPATSVVSEPGPVAEPTAPLHAGPVPGHFVPESGLAGPVDGAGALGTAPGPPAERAAPGDRAAPPSEAAVDATRTNVTAAAATVASEPVPVAGEAAPAGVTTSVAEPTLTPEAPVPAAGEPLARSAAPEPPPTAAAAPPAEATRAPDGLPRPSAVGVTRSPIRMASPRTDLLPDSSRATAESSGTDRRWGVASPVSGGTRSAETAGARPDPARRIGRGRGQSHVHRCGRCGHRSRHEGTCAIATVTDLIYCPVCDGTSARRPRARRALVAAIVGLALLPALWWLAGPWPTDRLARVVSELRELARVERTEPPAASDRPGAPSPPAATGATESTAPPASEPDDGPVSSSAATSSPSAPSLERPPPAESPRVRNDAAPRSAVPVPPARAVPPPPARPVPPPRAPEPSRIAGSPRMPPSPLVGSPAVGGNAPSNAGSAGLPGPPSASPGPAAIARPTPGPEDRPQTPPLAPVPGSGSAVAVAPPAEPVARPPGAPASGAPDVTGSAPARAAEGPVPPRPSSGSSPSAPPGAPGAKPSAGAPPQPPSPVPGRADAAVAPGSAPRGATADAPQDRARAELTIPGAPPPGSLGGPLLAAARSAGARPATGGPADVPPAPTRPRRAETAAPAMVRILALSSDGSRGASPNPMSPATPRGLGFLVDERGYVLTHADVIRDGKRLEAALADGRIFAVKQVWRDPLAGVAVLRIDGRDLPALPLGDSDRLRVGDATAIVGWPAASARPPVNATIRATGAATGGNLAIDAAVPTESIGGPLIDARGQVVGITSADAHLMDGSSRGFAVPIDRAKTMLREAQTATPPARPAFASGR